MPVPSEEPASRLPELLASAATELKDLPHIKQLNEPLAKAFEDLQSLLEKKTERYWKSADCREAFRKLANALPKALSVAAKWKRSKLRSLLYSSAFADNLSAALLKIRNPVDTLQVEFKPAKRDTARAIVRKLDTVVQGLGDRGELFLAAAYFKKKLLAFLRANQTSGAATTLISTWIAKHLDSEVDSIRQELQEIKDSIDSTTLHADHEDVDAEHEDVDAVLLEQLVLSLAVIEEKTAGETMILAEVKAKLQCSICDGLMINPVTVESGFSCCKHCMEERFRLGYSTCPGSKTEITNRNLVTNVVLQNVISSFGEADSDQPPPDYPSTSGGDLSDANPEAVPFDENSEKGVQVALESLTSQSRPRVLTGFCHLIKYVSSPGGPLAVFNATYTPPDNQPPVKAIPKVFALARTQTPQYLKPAMKFMVALTAGPDSEITLEVSDGLDVLISLMKEGNIKTRLLAAETVANILVNRQVRETVLSCDGIVPALYALWTVNPVGLSLKNLKQSDIVCLLGFQRLAKCSKRGDKTQVIVAALLGLIRCGLSYAPELTSLVKDSLVLLESIVVKDNTTKEILDVIRKDMKPDRLTQFEAHTTVPGRMAIIRILTKLCRGDPPHPDEEIINEYMFLLLLRMIERTRTEPSAPLLGPSVRLLCYCVTRAKATAQAVLREHVHERETLEEMVRREDSGIPDETRLEIQSILDQINVENTAGKVDILVKLSKSEDQRCRQQVASKLRAFIAENHNLSEFQAAGGVDALMTLLRDRIPDALIALQKFTRLTEYEIPVDNLLISIILDFLDERRPTEEKEAAIGLLDLIVKAPEGPATFVQRTGAVKTTLNFLSGPGCHKCASAVLQMARADESVRKRIAEPDLRGLDVVVKYVKDHGTFELRGLLTDTLVLFCESGDDACQEAVIRADGHVFLLASLREKISKGRAAQGLLTLIVAVGFREKVLEAGYVKIVLESIDARFVPTDIALGLAELSSFSEGLDLICTEPSSVPALLNLLEFCREPKGKNAAAQVVSRLYPRLNTRPEELERRKIIADRCDLLFSKEDPSDDSHIKAFLEALAAIAADGNGKHTIHELRGNDFLITNLSVSQRSDVQGLMLHILADMSSSDTDYNNMSVKVRNVRDQFIEKGVPEKLFALFRSSDFMDRTENVKSGLIIIRNLSDLGIPVVEKLAEQGAVEILVDVLKRYEGSLSVTTELTVKALEKFMGTTSGKQTLLNKGGVRPLASVLKMSTFGTTGDAKSLAAINILSEVAKDEQTCRDTCITLFNCNILGALNGIISGGGTNKSKWQAAVLMKLMAMNGPTKEVCIALEARGCLDRLLSLRDVAHCDVMANDVLKFVSKKSTECKRYIASRGR